MPATRPFDEETRRRRLCDHLGRKALAGAPKVSHAKCLGLHLGCTPPPAPALPYGSVWTLNNHLKVLRQYAELISLAASGQGPHSLPLSASKEACGGGLEWFSPLLDDLLPSDCQPRIDAWRQANPGLYENAEAAFHVHQSQASPDLLRHLVRCLMPDAKEYDAEIAGSLLRTRPSFSEFSDSFTRWRDNGLYHLMCLAARHMPMASHWMPRTLLHESGDWQDLLTHFNDHSFCTPERLEGAFLALWDRSPQLSNHICCLLDRLTILSRVCSREPRMPFEDCLSQLRLPTGGLEAQHGAWYALRRAMDACPPSLLCPTLYPPNRYTWGYRRLRLLLRDSRPYIHTGDLDWISKEDLDGCREGSFSLPDRLHDILLRIGEAATSPEVAHLMLHPDSLSDALAGHRVIRESLPNLADRALVMAEMDRPRPDDAAYRACVSRLSQALPAADTLQTQAHLLAWRVDCPPRVILYHGFAADVDPSDHAHRLNKSIRPDKLPNRTVSGISLLPDGQGVHDALRACIAEEVVGPHRSFSEHPHHQAPVRIDGYPALHTTTTLAEAVGAFTGPAPAELSEIPLHGSQPWSEGHVDVRYAERQVGDNGSRYRDWLAVYYDPSDPQPVQRCRLASHALKVDTIHRTHLPLIGQEGASWVSVASSLPMDTVMLRAQKAKTPLEALRRSVDARFMHDGKLLPVRHPGDKVEREHMEIYSDPKAGQVLIAYAPKSEDGRRLGIEFVSFMNAK